MDDEKEVTERLQQEYATRMTRLEEAARAARDYGLVLVSAKRLAELESLEAAKGKPAPVPGPDGKVVRQRLPGKTPKLLLAIFEQDPGKEWSSTMLTEELKKSYIFKGARPNHTVKGALRSLVKQGLIRQTTKSRGAIAARFRLK